MLPFELGPSLTHVVNRDEHRAIVRAFLVYCSEVGGKILAEEIDLLKGVIEDLHAACVKVVCYRINEGSILACKRQCDLVRFPRLDWCRSDDGSDYSSTACRTVFQEQFADPPQVSILEEDIPHDRRLVHAQVNSFASSGDTQQFL